MHGDLLLILLALVLGCGAFVVGIIYLTGRALATVIRGIVGWARPRGISSGSYPVGLRRGRVCPRPRCRRVEYREAKYCGQCGARLDG